MRMKNKRERKCRKCKQGTVGVGITWQLKVEKGTKSFLLASRLCNYLSLCVFKCFERENMMLMASVISEMMHWRPLVKASVNEH